MNYELKQIIVEIEVRNLPAYNKGENERFFDENGCRQRGGMKLRLAKNKNGELVGYISMNILDENEWFIERFDGMLLNNGHCISVAIERAAYVRVPIIATALRETEEAAQQQQQHTTQITLNFNIGANPNSQIDSEDRNQSRLVNFLTNQSARLENMAHTMVTEINKLTQVPVGNEE